MKVRNIDQEVFNELHRNHIHYWPDVRSFGVDISIPKGAVYTLYNGAIVKNANGRLVLMKASDGTCRCKRTDAIECRAFQESDTIDEILGRGCACPCHKGT